MLLSSVITCVFFSFSSYISQKNEENRENEMMQEIKKSFTEEVKEINSGIKIALEQSNLVRGDQEDILHKLLYESLEIGEISRIRILAHNSDSFSEFFTNYFRRKGFECKELNILVHNHEIDKTSDVVNEWYSLFENKEIETIRIRKARIDRRSFFGMIIDFEKHYSIGLIGFYKPQSADIREIIQPFDKRYGIFSEGDSILEVLDEYFTHYFNNDNSILLKEETRIKKD
jgi:hypothetical protein